MSTNKDTLKKIELLQETLEALTDYNCARLANVELASSKIEERIVEISKKIEKYIEQL